MDNIDLPELAYYQLRSAVAELQLARTLAEQHVKKAQTEYDRILQEALLPLLNGHNLSDYRIDLEKRKLVAKNEGG